MNGNSQICQLSFSHVSVYNLRSGLNDIISCISHGRRILFALGLGPAVQTWSMSERYMTWSKQNVKHTFEVLEIYESYFKSWMVSNCKKRHVDYSIYLVTPLQANRNCARKVYETINVILFNGHFF